MNYVSFSPHFPNNFRHFCVHLNRLGANVLGVGDAPFDEFHPSVKSSLCEYYRVQNPHNYDEMVRALGYLTHRYGKLDRYKSHNEYWLENDARLRTDFNIFGLKTPEMPAVKRKSIMKQRFIDAGIAVARGRSAKRFQKRRPLLLK